MAAHHDRRVVERVTGGCARQICGNAMAGHQTLARVVHGESAEDDRAKHNQRGHRPRFAYEPATWALGSASPEDGANPRIARSIRSVELESPVASSCKADRTATSKGVRT
jgi:hypothetical protein